MNRAFLILLLVGCEHDPLADDSPCRDLVLRAATKCPHPHQRLMVSAGGGCEGGTATCRCEARKPEGT